MAKYAKSRGLAGFFKRNAAYLIMIACVLATALIIVFASKPRDEIVLPPDEPVVTPPPDEPDEPVVSPEPETFLSPVAGARIGNIYNADTPVRLSVPDRNNNYQWVLFKEMEFIADQGTEVMAVYDGTILSVAYDIVDGTVVKIRHADGFVSTYKYLQKDAPVRAGDTVKRGDVIGHIGVSYNLQYHIGAHLCFGLLKDGVHVNPSDYLEL